jgi:hypoxanthine phosphoribosyltransferase
VVGIAHGGAFVGATVASILKRDFFPIKFSRRVNDKVVRKRVKLIVPPTAHLEGKNVLIVDDASISGETMKAAAKEIKRLDPKRVITAVLVQRGAFEPDFAAAYAGGEVAFPWQSLEAASDEAGAGPRPKRKEE